MIVFFSLFFMSPLFALSWNQDVAKEVEALVREGKFQQAESRLAEVEVDASQKSEVALWKTLVAYREEKWKKVLEESEGIAFKKDREVLSVRVDHMRQEAEKALGIVSVSGARYTKPYGMAGCGLGSVLKSQSQSQLGALSTNVSFSQSVSITFGTSNCSENGIIREGYEIGLFMEAHHELLAMELARGQGETLTQVTALRGCENEGWVKRSRERWAQEEGTAQEMILAETEICGKGSEQ